MSCDRVKTAIAGQIRKWTSRDNCPEGQPGGKCLYTVHSLIIKIFIMDNCGRFLDL